MKKTILSLAILINLILSGCSAEEKTKPITKATSIEEWVKLGQDKILEKEKECYRANKKIRKGKLPPMTDIEKKDCENVNKADAIETAQRQPSLRGWSDNSLNVKK